MNDTILKLTPFWCYNNWFQLYNTKAQEQHTCTDGCSPRTFHIFAHLLFWCHFTYFTMLTCSDFIRVAEIVNLQQVLIFRGSVEQFTLICFLLIYNKDKNLDGFGEKRIWSHSSGTNSPFIMMALMGKLFWHVTQISGTNSVIRPRTACTGPFFGCGRHLISLKWKQSRFYGAWNIRIRSWFTMWIRAKPVARSLVIISTRQISILQLMGIVWSFILLYYGRMK